MQAETTAGTIRKGHVREFLGNPEQESLGESGRETGKSVAQAECWPCLRPTLGRALPRGILGYFSEMGDSLSLGSKMAGCHETG